MTVLEAPSYHVPLMTPRDLGRLTLLASIWGSSFLLIKLALEDLSPVQIVLVRVVVGAAVLYAFTRYKRVPLPGRDLWPILAIMGVFSNLIPFALIGWGEERVASSMAAILNSTVPLFTAMLAAIFLASERATLLRSTGILVGFLGVGVIVGLESSGGTLGKLAVVLASLSYAVGLVYTRSKASGRAAPLSLSAGQLIVSSVMVAPLAAVDIVWHPPSFGFASIASSLALGALGTGVAYVLFFRLIQDVGATSASFVTYLIPLFGVVLGTVFLDESLHWNTYVGAIIVIAGIVIAEWAVRRHGERPKPTLQEAHGRA